jgi:NADPH:quinone reductase-like Zn-dependent oxidoreductase
MRAAIFHEHGGPEVVRVEDVETPEPGAGEVRLRVEAAGMNHLDLWVRRGLPVETTMPHIGGSDVVGVVDAVGPGVDDSVVGGRYVVNPSLWCGQCEWCRRGEESMCLNYRILGEHTQGGFAEHAVVPAVNLLPLPASYDAARVAAAPLVFLTAWRALISRARLRPGERVLITGASGGVSTAAIQIARLAGARVYAVTSTPFVDRVRELGADVVYDRNEVDFSKQVWKDTGKRGVDVVLDSVGEKTWTQCVRALAKGGRLVVYGATTGPKAELNIRQAFWKQIDVLGTTMSNRHEFDEVMSLILDGQLEPVLDVAWPLDRAAEAHTRLQGGESFGNIVLTP